MNRDSLRTLVVALLAVLVIATAAATLDSPVTEGGPDRDPGFGGEERTGEPWTPLDLGPEDPENETAGGSVHSMLGLCISALRRPVVILGALGLLGLATVPVYRRAGIPGALAVLMVVLPIGTLVYAFMTQCRANPDRAALPQFSFGQANRSGAAGNATGQATGAAGQFDSPVVLVLVGALFLLALAFVYLRTTGDEPRPEPDPEAEPDEVALSAIGEAAGDAADRLEATATFENEVYRAWREMTDLLDVPKPESSTPGEFAVAAGEAGMDREHVDALTDLFREVRYGGREPTEERERRAVESLRRIEAAYAGEDDR